MNFPLAIAEYSGYNKINGTKEGFFMAGASSIGGAAGISSLKFQAEYQAKAAALQKDAIELQGQSAVKLIQSAGVDGSGGQIDFSV